MKVQDPRLAEVFPNPPLVAFKRQKNIKDYLIRSKVPLKQSSQPKRNKNGLRNVVNPALHVLISRKGSLYKTKTQTGKLMVNLTANQAILYI